MPSLLEIEARLKDLEAWRPSKSEGEVVQKMIDWLDQALGHIEPKSGLYSRSARSLQALCRRSARLPFSCKLSDDITLLSPHSISSSALSDVYKGSMSGKYVAIKVLRVHVDNRDQVAKAFHNEAVMWKLLKHPNLVPFLGTSTVFPVCFISLWMPHGTIAAYLKQYPREDRTKFVKDVVRGLQYMHNLNVVHGDLKSANVLVDENCNARLGDFGVSTLMHHTAGMSGTLTTQGTLRWMSPELLICDPVSGSDGCPTKASDVYSLATVFWEIFSGRIPYEDIRKDYTVVAAVLGGRRPERPTGATAVGLQDTLWSIILRCWSAEPHSRPTLAEVSGTVTRRLNSTELPVNAVTSFFVPWSGGRRVPPVAPVAPQIPPCNAVSQNGLHAAIALKGGIIQVYTLSREGSQLARFPTFTTPRVIQRMAFSADGRYLLTSYEVRSESSTCMRVWRCQGKIWTAVGRTLKAVSRAIPLVYASGSNARILVLVVAGNSSSVRPYDPITGKSTSIAVRGPTASRKDGGDLALVTSPNEALAAAGSAIEVVLYRLHPFVALRVLTVGMLPMFSMFPTFDARTLALCDNSVNFIVDDALPGGRHWTCAWPLDGSGAVAEELVRMPPHHGATYARDGAALALRRCSSVLVYDGYSGTPAGPPLVQDQRSFWAPAAGFLGEEGRFITHVSGRTGAVSVWEVDGGKRVVEVDVGGRVVEDVEDSCIEECFDSVGSRKNMRFL